MASDPKAARKEVEAGAAVTHLVAGKAGLMSFVSGFVAGLKRPSTTAAF
jgi:hypothetical protein